MLTVWTRRTGQRLSTSTSLTTLSSTWKHPGAPEKRSFGRTETRTSPRDDSPKTKNKDDNQDDEEDQNTGSNFLVSFANRLKFAYLTKIKKSTAPEDIREALVTSAKGWPQIPPPFPSSISRKKWVDNNALRVAHLMDDSQHPLVSRLIEELEAGGDVGDPRRTISAMTIAGYSLYTSRKNLYSSLSGVLLFQSMSPEDSEKAALQALENSLLAFRLLDQSSRDFSEDLFVIRHTQALLPLISVLESTVDFRIDLSLQKNCLDLVSIVEKHYKLLSRSFFNVYNPKNLNDDYDHPDKLVHSFMLPSESIYEDEDQEKERGMYNVALTMMVQPDLQGDRFVTHRFFTQVQLFLERCLTSLDRSAKRFEDLDGLKDDSNLLERASQVQALRTRVKGLLKQHAEVAKDFLEEPASDATSGWTLLAPPFLSLQKAFSKVKANLPPAAREASPEQMFSQIPEHVDYDPFGHLGLLSHICGQQLFQGNVSAARHLALKRYRGNVHYWGISSEPTLAHAVAQQAAVELLDEKWSRAEELLREARELFLRIYEEKSVAVIAVDFNLLFVLSRTGRDDEASALFSDLKPRARSFFGPSHRWYRAIDNLSDLF